MLAVVVSWGQGPAKAMITEVGRESITMPSMADGLGPVVNHPARVSGRIGPFGPSAWFDYTGDTAAFNAVLALYGKAKQAEHILYLTEGDGSDFSLSLTHGGEGFLHLPAGARIPLKDVKLPPGVKVEFLPAVGGSLDPAVQRRTAATRASIEAYIAALPQAAR